MVEGVLIIIRFYRNEKGGGTPSLNFAAAKIGIIDGPFIMAALLLIEDCFSFGGTPILSSACSGPIRSPISVQSDH